MWSYFCRPRCKIIFFVLFCCVQHILTSFHNSLFPCIHCSFFVVPSEVMDRSFTVFPKHSKILLCLSLKGTFFYFFFYLPKFLASNTVTDFNINFSNLSHCNTDYNKPINYNHLSNIHTYVCAHTRACVCVCVCVHLPYILTPPAQNATGKKHEQWTCHTKKYTNMYYTVVVGFSVVSIKTSS